MKLTKVGLIGCGDWGKNILRDLKSLGCHVTVVSLSKHSHANAINYHADKIVNAISQLTDVEGVIVATPAITHFGIIKQIARLSIPIFVEKPMTANLHEAEYLANEFSDRLFVMHKWRYHAGVQALANIVASKELGEVRSLQTKRMNWGNHHSDVDMIWTCLPHDLSITIEILGKIPKPRVAVGLEWQQEAVELSCILGEKPWNSILISSVSTNVNREIKIECDHGIALLTDGYDNHISIHHKVDWGLDPNKYTEQRAFEFEMPLLLELKEFVNYLRGGKPPKCDAYEGLAVVKTIVELRQLAGFNCSGTLEDQFIENNTGKINSSHPSKPHPPRVSVIIATYNWSNALKFSLKSALAQTIHDIEIIVVGDGCTDDSESIVADIADKRVRWINLSKNSGSQAVPNNVGIGEAKGDFIAYLGHDDLWHPTHLEALLIAQAEIQATYIFSGAILYGPPDTMIRATTGMLPGNTPSRTDFAPPTTVMHKKGLVERIGPWKNNHEVTHPIDYEFQLRAWDSGAKFATTGKITAFKFPAAWWRDSYKKRDITRQKALFYKLHEDADIIKHELIDVKKATDLGLLQIAGDQLPKKKGQYYAINSLIKGTLEPNNRIVRKVKKLIFTMDTHCFAHEWHEMEYFGDEKVRWTGPRLESTVDIPFKASRGIKIKIHVLHAITSEVLLGLQLFVNNQAINFTLVQDEKIGWCLMCIVSEKIVFSGGKNNIRLMFKVPSVAIPAKISQDSFDKRVLGIAIGNIEIIHADSALIKILSRSKRYLQSVENQL